MAWKYDKDRITYFAETDFRGQRVKFGIREEDRARHMYIIGKTGMGKSTLLENLAVQDIINDEGLCFIDPHGGSAELLLRYVPEHRIKDVIYFAPHEMDFPVALNVLENDDPNKRPLIASGILSTFKKVWPDAWSGRMEYFLMNTLLALLETPGSTLLGVNRMYSDAAYREKVIANITDTSVRAFWVDEYANMTEKMVAEATPAIQNKVGQFSMNPIMRNILGQSESTFDIRWIMDNRKIFIVNLSKGRMGETNAALLGALLVTKIYLAAMSRADLSEGDLKTAAPFHLYVDEFQNFANDSFANILSEARKYKLALTIAHQYIEQMPEEVRDAVFGNVGTMITYRVGAGDAEVLEKEFTPTFTMDDIVGLGFAQIYLKLMIKGAASTAFSARTSDKPPAPEKNYELEVRAASREQFGRPREVVEESIKEWFTIDSGKGAGGDSRPGVKKFAPGQRPPSGGGYGGGTGGGFAGGARGGQAGGPGGFVRRNDERSSPGQQAEGVSLASALAKAGVASTKPSVREDDEDDGPRKSVQSPVTPQSAPHQMSPLNHTAPQGGAVSSGGVTQGAYDGSAQYSPQSIPPQYQGQMQQYTGQPYMQPQMYPQHPVYTPPPQQYYPPAPVYHTPQYFHPQQVQPYYPPYVHAPVYPYGYADPRYQQAYPDPQGYAHPGYQQPQLQQSYPQSAYHAFPPSAPLTAPQIPRNEQMSPPRPQPASAQPLQSHPVRDGARSERIVSNNTTAVTRAASMDERRPVRQTETPHVNRTGEPLARPSSRPLEHGSQLQQGLQSSRSTPVVRVSTTDEEVKLKASLGKDLIAPSSVQKMSPVPIRSVVSEGKPAVVSPVRTPQVPRAAMMTKVDVANLPQITTPRTPTPQNDSKLARQNDGKGPSGEKLDALAAALARLQGSKTIPAVGMDIPEKVTPEVRPLSIDASAKAPVQDVPVPRSAIPVKPPVQSQEEKPPLREVPLDVLKKVLE